jgi:transposase
MEGHLLMSLKERQRISTFERVARKELSLLQAAEQLGISRRQCRRTLRRYESEGDAGLIHKLRGEPSTHRKAPDFKAAVLDLCRSKYPDFGPTLAAEKLFERDQKQVHPETLRLWLIADGQRALRKSKSRHRTWRKRKAHFGEMVQMDGSVHDWFEGRGPRCFVMSMVDDATGTTLLLFSQEETTFAAMLLLEAWVKLYGIPVSLYVDRKNVYVTDREQTQEEQLTAMPPLTQFGRACHQLGVRIIEANSPQAKGRVERKHAVCQDRLIKEMRLDGFSDIDAGNRFLLTWTPKLNAKFAVEPENNTDMHRPLPKALDLRTVFCTVHQRTLGADFTLRYLNRWFQVDKQPDLPCPKSRITIRIQPDGKVALLQNLSDLAFHELAERPAKLAKEKKERTLPVPVKPAQDHPWRQPKRTFVNPRDIQTEVAALATQYLGGLLPHDYDAATISIAGRIAG